MKVNLKKTKMLGVHIGDTELRSLAQRLGYATETLPSSYLGLPLCLGKPRKELWDDLIQRFTWKFSWKGRFLSLGGRITLIRATLASIPVYYMSLFQIPISVIQHLEKLMRDFLWSREEGSKKIHIVAWDIVCSPKKFWGLGIKNLRTMNLALLGKWWWRFSSPHPLLWKQVIQEKYGPTNGEWIPRAPPHRSSGVWTCISTIRNAFLQRTRYRLGYGYRILCWLETLLFQWLSLLSS
ncbi:hypothetical protein AMTRI_Chr10g2150 [Amborella trichopoda]